jgi:hypothetical protein
MKATEEFILSFNLRSNPMIRSVLAAIIIVFLAACIPVSNLVDKQESDFPISYLDSQAADSIDLLNHRAERLPSGHLSIAFTCQSAFEKKPAIIDWKVVFFDTQQMPMDETEWHTEYLMPGEVKMLQASSIRTDCAAFQVQVRTPRQMGTSTGTVPRRQPGAVQGQQIGVVPPQGAPQQGTTPAQGNPPQGPLETIQQITNEVLPALKQIQK